MQLRHALLPLFGLLAPALGWPQAFNLVRVGEVPVQPYYFMEAVDQNLLILGLGDSGIGTYIYDIGSPAAPVFKRFYPVPDPQNPHSYAARLFGHTVYMQDFSSAGSNNRILAYDLNGNGPPAILLARGNAVAFVVRGNILYYVSSDSYEGQVWFLSALDLSDVNAPMDSLAVPEKISYGDAFEWVEEDKLAYYSRAGIHLLDVSKKYDFQVVQYIERQEATSILYLPEIPMFLSAFHSGINRNVAARVVANFPGVESLTDNALLFPKHSIFALASLTPHFVVAGSSNGVDVYQVLPNLQRMVLAGHYSSVNSVVHMATTQGKFIYSGDGGANVDILEYTGLPQPQPQMNAEIVSQPASEVMAPGQKATLQVTMKNTGMEEWTQYNYSLALIEDSLSVWDEFFPRDGIGASPIAPGQNFTFTFNLKGPAAAGGSGVMKLQMVHEFVEFFGPVVEIPIQILAPTEQLNASKRWFLYN